MRELRLLLTAGLALLGSSAFAENEELDTPIPGRDIVKPMKPDWCDNAQIESWVASRAPRDLINSLDRQMHRINDATIAQMGQMACAQPNDDDMRKSVAKYRQRYINLVGSTDAEDRAALKLRVSAKWEEQKKTWCASLEPGAEASPEEKSMSEAIGTGTGCNRDGGASQTSRNGMNPQLGWWLDKRADADSEVARAVYVLRCLRFLKDEAWLVDPKSEVVQGAYAVCGVDARRLDKARLEKEIADSKWNEFARINARETFALAKAISTQLEAEYRKLAAKDESYKSILFDAPEKGWTNWEKLYAANKDAFEAARAYETKFYGPSKKALQGCSATLRKNFADYVRAAKPQTAEEAKKVARDPIGAVLLSSLSLCDAVEGRFHAAEVEADVVTGANKEQVQDRRGPRFEAYYATVSALSDVLANRERFPLGSTFFRFAIERPRDTVLYGAASYYTNKTSFRADAKGQIASVAKKGEVSTVTFKKVKYKELVLDCTYTKRILRINSDGSLDYERHCTGHDEWKTSEEPAVAVPGTIAGGFKAGDTAVFGVDERNDRLGFPKEIYSGKDGKKLAVWYGVDL